MSLCQDYFGFALKSYFTLFAFGGNRSENKGVLGGTVLEDPLKRSNKSEGSSLPIWVGESLVHEDL